MRKYFFNAAIAMMAFVGFTACSSDDDETVVSGTEKEVVEDYNVRLTVTNNGNQAKLDPTGSGDDVWLDAKWEQGDQITIYHYTNGLADGEPLTLTADADGDIVTFSGEETAAKGKWNVGDYVIATFPKSGDNLTVNNNNGVISAQFSLDGQDGTLETIRNKYNLETATGQVTSVSAEGDVRVSLNTGQFRSLVAIARYAFYVDNGNGSYTRLKDYKTLEVGNLVTEFEVLKGGNDGPNLFHVNKPDAYTTTNRHSVTFTGAALSGIMYMPYVVFPLDDPNQNNEHLSAPTFTITMNDGTKYFGQIGGTANGMDNDYTGAQYQAGRYYQVNVKVRRM